MSHIFLKHTLRVRVVAKRNILVIALFVYFPAIGAEAISEPSLVKSAAAPPRHELTELYNSYLQGGEGSAKNFVYCHAVARPADGVWVQTIEGDKNSGTKSSAGVGVTGLVVVSPNKVSTKAGDKKTTNDAGFINKESFYQFLHGALFAILIAWPIMFFGDAGPYGGLKPNVKVRGAPLLGRPS